MATRKRNEPAPPASTAIADKQDRWRARDALSTLNRAEEIRGDKELMREVKKEAKAQIKTAQKVIGGGKVKPRG
jgi:hypothetical protein